MSEETLVGGTWTQIKRKMNRNELELLVLKLALTTFLKTRRETSVHIQMDNVIALTSFIKMGDTRILKMFYLPLRNFT